MYLNQCYYIKY